MQVAEGVSQEVLQQYEDGEVTFVNTDNGTLCKGILRSITADESWTRITMQITQNGTRSSSVEGGIKWQVAKPSGISPATLRSPGVVNEQGALVFDQPTERGSTAVITRA